MPRRLPICETKMPIFTIATRCFEEVARSGSIRRASERLNLSASAVNRQILKLEEQFGLALFERLPRGMRLTAAGEMLIVSLRRQHRELDGVFSQIDELKGLRRGHVVIACLQYLAQVHLSRFVREFRREFPGITFTILVGSAREVETYVLDNTADLGICYEPQRGLGLVRTLAVKSRLGVATSLDHPLATARTVKLRDCVAHPIVLPTRGMESRSFAEQLNLSRYPDLLVATETNSFPTFMEMIKNGTGIGFITDIDAVHAVSSGQMKYLSIAEPDVPAPLVCTVIKQHRAMPFAASLVLERLGADLLDITSQTQKLFAAAQVDR